MTETHLTKMLIALPKVQKAWVKYLAHQSHQNSSQYIRSLILKAEQEHRAINPGPYDLTLRDKDVYIGGEENSGH